MLQFYYICNSGFKGVILHERVILTLMCCTVESADPGQTAPSLMRLLTVCSCLSV